jgi:hypothetical protein
MLGKACDAALNSPPRDVRGRTADAVAVEPHDLSFSLRVFSSACVPCYRSRLRTHRIPQLPPAFLFRH